MKTFFAAAFLASFGVLAVVLLCNFWFLHRNFEKIFRCFEGSDRLKYFLRFAEFGGFRSKWTFYNFVVGMLQRKSWYVNKGYVEKKYIDSFPVELEVSMKRFWWCSTGVFTVGVVNGLLFVWFK